MIQIADGGMPGVIPVIGLFLQKRRLPQIQQPQDHREDDHPGPEEPSAHVGPRPAVLPGEDEAHQSGNRGCHGDGNGDEHGGIERKAQPQQIAQKAPSQKQHQDSREQKAAGMPPLQAPAGKGPSAMNDCSKQACRQKTARLRGLRRKPMAAEQEKDQEIKEAAKSERGLAAGRKGCGGAGADQVQQLPEIIEDDAAVHLGLALVAVIESDGHLADPQLAVSRDQGLQGDLEAADRFIKAGQMLPANREKSRQRVLGVGENPGRERGQPGGDLPAQRPVGSRSPRRVPAADHHVEGAGGQGGYELRQDLRRMAEIGVHDHHDPGPGGPGPFNHGAGQAVFGLAADQGHRMGLLPAAHLRPGAVSGTVINNDHLQRQFSCLGRLEDRCSPPHSAWER